MMTRSAVYFRGGMLLIVVGTVFSMPSVLAVSGSFPELGEAWRSPLGVALGVISVVGGGGLVVYAFRLRSAERAEKKRKKADRGPTGAPGS